MQEYIFISKPNRYETGPETSSGKHTDSVIAIRRGTISCALSDVIISD